MCDSKTHQIHKSAGFVSSIPEFCNAWLGRSEGYIRTLRYHDLDPSWLCSVCVRTNLGIMRKGLKTAQKPSIPIQRDHLNSLSSCVTKKLPSNHKQFGDSQKEWAHEIFGKARGDYPTVFGKVGAPWMTHVKKCASSLM